MYLYKPSEKSTSEPVEFWYIPKHKNNMENNKKPDPSPKMELMKPKTNMKREREKHVNRNQDDPSSGMINVPPKITPEQLRGAGGQVSVVSNNHTSTVQPLGPPPPTTMYNHQFHAPNQSYTAYINNVAAAAAAAAANGNHHMPAYEQQGQIMSHMIPQPQQQEMSNLHQMSSKTSGGFASQVAAASQSEYLPNSIPSLTNIDINTGKISMVV